MSASWKTPASPTCQATPVGPQDYAAAAVDAAEGKAALQQLRDQQLHQQQLHQQQLIQKLESDVSRYQVLPLGSLFTQLVRCNA